MSEKRFGVAEFSLGLLVGIAAGTVAGLLMAPRSGAETRGQIAGRASDIKYMASELVDQAKTNFEIAATQIEKVVGLQERNLRRKLDEISNQLEEYHLNEIKSS